MNDQDLLPKFQKLVKIVADLRGPNGCPWDKEQNQKTLTQYVLEEAFELVEAIESENQIEICDELGDYLFQVILQAQVAQDEKYFALDKVLDSINEKLVRRHPHVFTPTADTNSATITSEEVWKNWHKLKSEEASAKVKPVFSYPKNLPALQAAHKIGKKTEGYKFDWENSSQVLIKVKEELHELEEAIPVGNKKHIQHEIGDLLFSIAQLARHLDLEPEACLREGNRRFENRFNKVLELANKDNSTQINTNLTREEFAKLPNQTKEVLWSEAKKLCQTDEQ